jgi:hypothetical protein
MSSAKIQTRGDCGLWKELAVACRMTQSTKVAQRREYCRKRYDQDIVVQETRKGLTYRKRCWKDPECNNGIRNPCTRWQPCLKIKRISQEFGRKALGLEFV